MVFVERVHKGDDDVFALGSRFAHRPYPLPTTLTMKTRPALTLHPPELHFIVLLTEAVQAVGKHHLRQHEWRVTDLSLLDSLQCFSLCLNIPLMSCCDINVICCFIEAAILILSYFIWSLSYKRKNPLNIFRANKMLFIITCFPRHRVLSYLPMTRSMNRSRNWKEINTTDWNNKNVGQVF